jgi:CheY-like chemotaxis protein
VSKRTLLLADDSVTIQKVVNLTFADEGIDVVTVGDGDAAMEKISQISPDVLLLDVHMPGLNGYQICDIVRQNSVTQGIPVILLVGSFEPFDESEAARVGANAYLTKPFQSIRQLVSQVTELMNASRPEAEQTFSDESDSDRPAEPSRPEEAQHGNPPATDDIESLYHQSVSAPTRPEVEVDSAATRYVDAGMDDEMIETSSFESPVHVQSPDSDTSYTETGEEPYREPMSDSAASDDWKDRPERSENYEATNSPMEPVGGENRNEARTSEFQYQDTNEEPAYAQGSGSPPAGSGEIGAAVASATTDAFSEFDQFSRTEQIPPLENRAVASLDDDLLDLPPIANANTLEFTAKQPGGHETGSKQVVSLSPELMEMIVQKVVEKLSDKN